MKRAVPGRSWDQEAQTYQNLCCLCEVSGECRFSCDQGKNQARQDGLQVRKRQIPSPTGLLKGFKPLILGPGPFKKGSRVGQELPGFNPWPIIKARLLVFQTLFILGQVFSNKQRNGFKPIWCGFQEFQLFRGSISPNWAGVFHWKRAWWINWFNSHFWGVPWEGNWNLGPGGALFFPG